MKIIGNREALELARKEFGPKAYAMRSGRRYSIGCTGWNMGRYLVVREHGSGRSWSEALKNAGITPPDPLGQVIEKVRQEGGGE